MVKYIQGMFISWDVTMYDKKKRIPARVQTSTLNEELGQVKFIFSDKTGTLTKNYMEFRRMSIGTYVYGSERRDDGEEVIYLDERGEITNVNFNDPKFEIQKRDELHENYMNIHLFLQCISLCHTVITDSKEELNNKLVYQASSPDETALVNAGRFFKYIFKGRDINNNIFLEIEGRTYQYTLLNLLEYSSERKRMSVIVRCPDNKIRLFIKGADSIIRERVTQNQNLITITDKHLYTFAKHGLRTLMIAHRIIEEDIYKEWNERYMDCISTPELKEKYLPQLSDEIERDLYLLGATAIEDQLQDDVDKTLEIFIRTGIKVWMLTGDKMDTAKSIAYSCRLITHEFDVFEMKEGTKYEEISENLKIPLNRIALDPYNKYALIIGTEEITKIMNNQLLTEFVNILLL
jgi:magnesium-transporting ATPase (P-type)